MEISEVKIISVWADIDDLGFILTWEEDSGYFGQMRFSVAEAGNRTIIDSENMSKEFIKKVLTKLVDDAELEE